MNGGLKAGRGGATASPAPFSELASEPEAMSWAGIDPTKVSGRRRGRRCFGMVRSCELRKVPPAKVGGAWGRREEGLSPLKSVPSTGGSGGSRAREKKKNSEKESSGMVDVGRRGEGASPHKPILGSKRSCPET